MDKVTAVQYVQCLMRGKLSYISVKGLSSIYLFTRSGFSLVDCLPLDCRLPIDSSWSLPKKIVIKEYSYEKDRSYEREMWETEQAAYKRLMPVQGRYVPRCYGPVRILNSDKPAIALQYLEGDHLGSLCLDESAEFEPTEIYAGMTQGFRAISQCLAVHTDVDPTKLDNLMWARCTKFSYLDLLLTCTVALSILLWSWLTLGLSSAHSLIVSCRLEHTSRTC
jgi:hypothetical protein